MEKSKIPNGLTSRNDAVDAAVSPSLRAELDKHIDSLHPQGLEETTSQPYAMLSSTQQDSRQHAQQESISTSNMHFKNFTVLTTAESTANEKNSSK